MNIITRPRSSRLPSLAPLTLALSAAILSLPGIARSETVTNLDATGNPGRWINGSGHVVIETRKVSGFHGVQLDNAGRVIITQDDTEGLVIEGEDNLLPLIKADVSASGILHLGFKNHPGQSVRVTKDLVFRLSVKTLDEMVLQGSGSIHAASLAADHPQIRLQGSGDIVVEHLKADVVTVELDGSGKVVLAGKARREKMALNGSGIYDAANLECEEVSVEINSSSEGKVWADKALAVEVNGSGTLAYYGRPTTLRQDINGSGKIHFLGEKNG